MDPDGDLMLVEYPADPNNLFTWRYIGGTGKFKGVTGGRGMETDAARQAH